MKISDFELSEKGEKYLEPKLESPGELGRLDRALLVVKTQTVERGKEYSDTLNLLPKLLGRGLIAYEPQSAKELIFKIESPTVRKDIDIYRKLAEESPTSDREIDYLFSKVKLGVHSYLKQLGDEAGINYLDYEVEALPLTSPIKSLVRQTRQARSRSDKVIAIDSAMSAVHDAGRVQSFPFLWGRISITDSDEEAVNRSLTKLSEG